MTLAVQELGWAKHTSIVTDYGEDVWGPRGRQGRRNSGQKVARGDSPEEEIGLSHGFRKGFCLLFGGFRLFSPLGIGV